ncbi:MAG: S9 family peptidase, partial [Mycobacterium sp.]|nr:S9 family peptidase [Mycobacterium sp.]
MTAGVEHPEDPYLWLEDITGERALDFARTRGEWAAARFASSERFDEIRCRILDMLDTDTKIPYPSRRGRWFYNYWRDAAQPRGVWRRTTFEEYSKDDPDWEVLLDLDAVAAAEEENWVWGGASVFRPDQTRALLSLSRGGADAKVVREFDMLTKKFVSPEDGGFTLPEAKSQIGWIDIDTVYVETDFGPGSLTESGYPRIAKRWRRGTPLSQAETIFEGKPGDVAVTAGYDRTPGFERHFVSRATDFFNEDVFLVESDDSVVRLDVPTDAGISWYRDWLLIRTKSPWSVGDREYGAGMLLVADFPKFLVGQRDLEVLFAPDAHTYLHGYAWT